MFRILNLVIPNVIVIKNLSYKNKKGIFTISIIQI